MNRPMLTTATLLAVLISCTPRSTADATSAFTAEDDAAVRSVLAQWARNSSEGRFMDNLALHTDDAVELLTPPVEGKEAMRSRWEAGLSGKEFGTTTLSVREVAGMGDLAYAWAQFRQEGVAAGTPFAADGNWMVLLRREASGDWRIHRTIWTEAAVEASQEAS